MTIERRVKETLADLESILISVSDLLYQLDMGSYSIENDDYKNTLQAIKKDLSGLIQKLAYSEDKNL